MTIGARWPWSLAGNLFRSGMRGVWTALCSGVFAAAAAHAAADVGAMPATTITHPAQLDAPASPGSTEQEPPPFSPPGNFSNGGQFMHADGATLYRAICQGCHMPDAKGASGAGSYPALAGNPKLASAAYPVLTVLQGRHGMPPFAGYLSDAQVAAVVNYVRSHFGNHYTQELHAEEIQRLRQAVAGQ